MGSGGRPGAPLRLRVACERVRARVAEGWCDMRAAQAQAKGCVGKAARRVALF